MTRDPRVDPRPGDVVGDHGWTRWVEQRVESGVWIHFEKDGTDIEGERFVPMDEWVRISKDAEIVKVAE